MGDQSDNSLHIETQKLRNRLERIEQTLRAVQDNLPENEKLFHALADMLSDIVFTHLPDGSCNYVSKRLQEITGPLPEEKSKEGWLAALHPEDHSRIKDDLSKAIASGTPFECRCRLRTAHKDDRLFVGRTRPLCDNAGKVVLWLGILMDVHDLKTAEDALEQARWQRDEFLSILVHDLRNMLAPIQNAVELLKHSESARHLKKRATEIIDGQARGFHRLLDDLANASKLAHGQIELHQKRVLLTEVVSQAVFVSRPSIEQHKHQLAVDLPSEPVWLLGDKAGLVQIVSSLLQNSARYTDEEGRIALSVFLEGNEVVLKIADTGIGIAPEVLPCVFDLFFHADRSRRGLGIGLALVRKLVEMHKGRVQAFSAGLGHGSTFTVRLPRFADIEDPPLPVTDSTDTLLQSPSRKILLVTNQPDFAEEWALLLRVAGHEVQTIGNVAEVLDAARSFQPDVISLDLGCAESARQGLEAVRQLRQQTSTQQGLIIAITADIDEELRHEVLAAGCDGLLSKPLKIRDFLRLMSIRSNAKSV